MNLNAGIRRTVAWLQANGFRTTDSGDGKTHDYECDRGYPYVVMLTEPETLIAETRRLRGLLADRGVQVQAVSPDGSGVYIQASFDPIDEFACINLMGLDDKRLAQQVPPLDKAGAALGDGPLSPPAHGRRDTSIIAQSNQQTALPLEVPV